MDLGIITDNILDRQIFAKTLKEGNLLYFKKPVHVQLGYIDIKSMTVKVSTYGIHLVEADEKTQVLPVLITPEWLRVIGFTLLNDNQTYIIPIYEKEECYISIKYSNGCYYTSLNFMGLHTPLYNYRFIHELQNLYAALAPGYYLTPDYTKA
jgi:hypothetical protein